LLLAACCLLSQLAVAVAVYVYSLCLYTVLYRTAERGQAKRVWVWMPIPLIAHTRAMDQRNAQRSKTPPHFAFRSSQRQRPQDLTSASAGADAIWGAHRPNYIHGQFGGIFFAPQVPPPPRCTPVVISTNLTSRLSLAHSCSVLRGPAPLRPHPSGGAPAGLTPAGLHPAAGGQAKQKQRI
jgi:hypothetical protein